MSNDTPESREEARQRGYRLRAVRPSEEAQSRYPLNAFPCERCENEGLPHLVDSGCEFSWQHQHEPPGSSARTGCPRFGIAEHCSSQPRPGTATSLFRQLANGQYVPRTESEYLAAQGQVKEHGKDDVRERLPPTWRW